MTLTSGSRLGPYEILSPIGAGGMGEVYRARDTRLGRTVAIKVLPTHLSSSPGARERFEREAKTISALSHPHVCALYDVGREGEDEYLVMELLEGETLAERLVAGPLPLDQTLRLGAQIASALGAAHRKGIVHRDLKPSNVMLTKSGVKLLDFGLAKALAPLPTLESLTAAPTTAKDVTQSGMILGTVPYMAPEQLQGKDADSRVDIFAFGAVLHEMATGKKAFEGTSPISIMSAILTSEPPPISSVQRTSPPSLDRLVRTCLAKDPDQRWETARDVELQLVAIAEAGSAAQAAVPGASPVRKRWLPWLIAGLAVAVAAAVLLRAASSRRPAAALVRFSVPPPSGGAFDYFVETSFLAVSPDGSQLAYVAMEPQGGGRIFVRPLAALEARPIPGTEGATSLFFSFDGRSLGFFAGNNLKRVELSGGAPVTICEASPAGGNAGSWGRDGKILFAGVQRDSIYSVPSSGGTPVAAVRLDPARGQARVSWPEFLPDGRSFLYLLRYLDGHGELMLSEVGKPPRVLVPMQSRVFYVDPGYLLFVRDGALLAQRFDSRSGRVTGEPFSVAEHVRYFFSTGAAALAASSSGTIAYQSQQDLMRLTWYDRAGRELGTLGSLGGYLDLAISPDGRRLLFDRMRPGIGTYDVWSLDLERGVEVPITSEPDTHAFPLWLPGGKSIVYSAVRRRAPQLVRRDLATGREEELFRTDGFQIAQDVSPDGQTLIYTERTADGPSDIWALPLATGAKPSALLQAPFGKSDVCFSPDGRYLAMITRESGQLEVYVTAYPGPGERIRASTHGVAEPTIGGKLLRWSRDGRELLYVSADRHLMSVPIRTVPALEIGTPTPLFALQGKAGWTSFDVSPDGKRFLAIVPMIVADELPLSVVVNWSAETGKN